MIPGTRFVVLEKAAHNRQSFDCGSEELNRFVQQFAARHYEAGISKTMVLPAAKHVDGKEPICAYYTLSHTEIERQTLPASLVKRLPHYPVPVMLIAQLAVHQQCQGQGLGKIALIRALRHCLEINLHLPSFAVVVDALDEEVQDFYRQFGFESLGKHHSRLRLYLPMNTVAQLFA